VLLVVHVTSSEVHSSVVLAEQQGNAFPHLTNLRKDRAKNSLSEVRPDLSVRTPSAYSFLKKSKGNEFLAELIAKYWPDIKDVDDPLSPNDDPSQSLFVIEYAFDNVTYQKQYEDETWGLLSTETYLGLILPKADPRSPV